MLKVPMLHKLHFGIPSEDYHAISGTYSSSQLKDLLEDEELFIKKHVKKTIEREDVPAFSIGNYFHTGILEPHKLKSETVVYPGKIRRGATWERFKAKNKNKTIISEAQILQAKGLISSVQDSPIAMSYVKRGKPEVSLFSEINVIGNIVYSLKYSKALSRDGWIPVAPDQKAKLIKQKRVDLIIKVRADSLGDDFVLDLKSTTGNAKNEQAMREKIKYYEYNLSAALYLDMFSLPKQEPINNFIWTFASKDYFNSKSYVASRNNIIAGRMKYYKTLISLADLIKSNWAVYDSLGVLDNHYSDLQYLQEPDTDLL